MKWGHVVKRKLKGRAVLNGGGMFKISLIIAVMVSFLGSGLPSRGQSPSAKGEEAPIIQIEETSYTFPTVYEGEELSHTFTLLNKGTATLNIKKVTHS